MAKFYSNVKRYIPQPIKTGVKNIYIRLSTFNARYHCSVCNNRVSFFQPLPKFFEENAQRYGFSYTIEEAETCNAQSYSCPWCLASDRDRLYALYLRDYLADSKLANQTLKIIDFAPTSPLSSFIRKQAALSGVNILYRTADLFAEGVDDRVDITNMGLYAECQFDFFICSHILEHVNDDRKALKELYRILKAGGQGILVVPIVLTLQEIDEDPNVINEAERWRRFGQHDHVRLYSKSGFIKRVQEAGFLLHQYGKEFFTQELLYRTGITDQSVLYIVKK